MNMKQLRQKVGLKAEIVAVQLGIGVSTIRNWEQGRTIPKLRLEQFVELCRLYQCSIEELYRAAKQSTREQGAACDRTLTPGGAS